VRYAYWPRKVVWHDHLFPSSRAWDSDDESNRFDAVEFDDGEFAVTDPFSDPPHKIVANCLSREDATRVAQRFADEAEGK
jgi:hypothetical protein